MPEKNEGLLKNRITIACDSHMHNDDCETAFIIERQLHEDVDKAKKELPTLNQPRFRNASESGIFLGFFWEDFYKEYEAWIKKYFGDSE